MAKRQPLWRIDLLGPLCATHLQSGQTLMRFRTHKTGALLAYLAFYPDRPHLRESLIDLIWPTVRIETGRHNLSNALTALRHQLEPPNVPANTVFTANRTTIQLHSAAVTTDVILFERALHDAVQATDPQEKLNLLLPALEHFNGVLLPGYYETWVLPEQQRLQEKFGDAARESIALLRQTGDFDRAILIARGAVNLDRINDETQRLLLELLAETGQIHAALRQYREFARTVEEELGQPPSSEMQQFVQQQLLRKTSSVPASSPKDTATVSRLPARITRFFGRQNEQTRLREMLSDPETRLLTLIGPGGVGKTRLALEVADKISLLFAGGVWFVPLSDVTATENLTSTTLSWMGVSPSPQSDAQRLIAALSRQRSLLLLDNFEHLIAGGALWVQTLLEQVPTLTCLITSRQCLQLSGETLFHVTPLPSTGGATTPEAILQNESVRLFVDRAQAVRPVFAVTEQNAPAIAELCDRLEGLPLALELAAARAQTLTPTQMLEQMKQRFAFLVSRNQDRAVRHRTLSDTLGWSHRLLTPRAQKFFARLSVFCGGWSWEAAETVCDEPDALDLLAQLCECSLLMAVDSGAEIRFRMLDTVREFAQEQVNAETSTMLDDRHTAYFLKLAKQAEPQLKGAQQADWLERLEREHDNFCAVLLRCAQSEAAEDRRTGLEIAALLWRFWYVRGHLSEGRDWFSRLLPPMPMGEADALYAKALNNAGCLAWGQNDLAEARRLLEASLTMQRELGDAIRTASALNNLGLVARAQGDLEAAIDFHQEALTIQREINDGQEIALSLNNLAAATAERGDDSTAQTLYTESVALWRTLDSPWGLALALSNLGAVLQRLGQYEKARAILEEGLAIRRQLNDVGGVAMSLTVLGTAACVAQDFAASAAFHEEALQLHRKVGNPRYLVQALHATGDLALQQGNLTGAAAHYTEALQIYQQMNVTDSLGLECVECAANLAEASHNTERGAHFRKTAADRKQSLKNGVTTPESLSAWPQILDAATAFLANFQND